MEPTIEIKEESAKFIYQDGLIVGFWKQNGTLKLYTSEEAKYAELEQLFSRSKKV